MAAYDCNIPNIVFLGTLIHDGSAFVSTTVGMVLAIGGISHTIYARLRSWQIFAAIIVIFFFVHFFAQMFNCYYTNYNEDNSLASETPEKWLYFLVQCSTALLGVSMTFLALYDLSIFSVSLRTGLGIVISWGVIIIIWSQYFIEVPPSKDSSFLGGWTTVIGLSCFVLLEFILLYTKKAYLELTLLIAMVCTGIGFSEILSENIWVLCDTPLWHWYTYAGLLYTEVDILFLMLYLFYWQTRDKPTPEIEDSPGERLGDWMSYFKLPEEKEAGYLERNPDANPTDIGSALYQEAVKTDRQDEHLLAEEQFCRIETDSLGNRWHVTKHNAWIIADRSGVIPEPRIIRRPGMNSKTLKIKMNPKNSRFISDPKISDDWASYPSPTSIANTSVPSGMVFSPVFDQRLETVESDHQLNIKDNISLRNNVVPKNNEQIISQDAQVATFEGSADLPGSNYE